MRKYKQGVFKPTKPEKYRGDVKNIIYRSGWEKRVMDWLDTDDRVLQWSSEEVVVPYVSPLDNRRHRYFVDFLAELLQPDGTKKTWLLEVKPKAQTIEPQKPKRRTKRFIQEVVTYGINQAKWAAATEFAADKGWEFKLITEAELFRKKV